MGRRALREEITMFSPDQKVGTAFLALLDNERRSLELIGGHENPQGSLVQSAIENTQELTDHLAGWLMKGRHHTCPGHRSSKANWLQPYEGIGGRPVIMLGRTRWQRCLWPRRRYAETDSDLRILRHIYDCG
jgi:hypothetical protein